MTLLRKLFPVLGLLLLLGALARNGNSQLAPPDPATPGNPPSLIVRAIDIQFAGAATVSKEKILANMRTQVGRPYSQQAVEDDIRNLYATGNVSNVRIFGEQVKDGVKVVVVVAGKSAITAVEIQGATRFPESRLRKQISTKPKDSLNEATLESD